MYQASHFFWTGAKSAVAPDGTIWWLNVDRNNLITLAKLPAGAASAQQYPMPSGFYSNSDNFGYGTMYNSEYDAYGGMVLLPENANSVWLVGREYHVVTDGREQRANDWSARLFVAMHFQNGAWGPKKFVLPPEWDQSSTNQYDAALNKNGQPVIVFSGLRTKSTTPSKDSVWVTHWNGSAFTAPLSISPASEYARHNPAMTIDAQNRVHIVWSQDRPSQASAIYYARGTMDDFEAPVAISDHPDYPACIPDVETMPNGEPVVIYCQYDGNNMHIYSRRTVMKASSPLREYAER
ncbi:glycoside hydrolase [bacterium]|nr:glycoside hydrolase [bacterium]